MVSGIHSSMKYLYHGELYQDNLKTYTNFLMANYCMPTLLGKKPSSLFHITKNRIGFHTTSFLCNLTEEISPFYCKYAILYENDLMLLILIYREELLKEVIHSKEEQNFLQSMGYRFPDSDIEDIISKLKQRYRAFKENKEKSRLEIGNYQTDSGVDKGVSNLNDAEETDFPHEIGVILGYPVTDVKSFILNNGKNYLICGYWKVYHNVDLAKITFDYYQAVREIALQCVYSGMNLRDLITATQNTSKDSRCN